MPGKTTRNFLIAVAAVAIATVAFPFVHLLLQRLGGNHYPGTAQQSEAMALLGQGKSLSLRLKMYADERGWPNHLSEIVGYEGTTEEMLRYPRIYDMPDRRDLGGWHDFDQWIYIKPREGDAERPLLIAPIPYTGSMGHPLPKPRRIIIHRDTVAETVDEDAFAPVLRALVER